MDNPGVNVSLGKTVNASAPGGLTSTLYEWMIWKFPGH